MEPGMTDHQVKILMTKTTTKIRTILLEITGIERIGADIYITLRGLGSDWNDVKFTFRDRENNCNLYSIGDRFICGEHK
jgi:hypothetical protein